MNLNVEQLVTDYVIPYGTKAILCLLLLMIGWWVVGMIVKGISKLIGGKGIDPTIESVLISTLSIVLKILLILAVITTLGVSTTSFVAVFGALSLAAGMAFQGSLGNLAGGLLILMFRPFKVGEYIKAQGEEGFVKEVQLLVTVLETPDKVTVYLPNGSLSANKISNISRQGTLRLHIPVGIGYGADIQQARDVLLAAMKSNPLVLDEPAPSVAVVNLGDSSIDLDLRPWCNSGDAPSVTVSVLEAAKIALDKAEIDIPYPHQVVYMNNAN